MDYDGCERNDFDKEDDYIDFLKMKLEYYFIAVTKCAGCTWQPKKQTTAKKRQKMSTISGKLTERNKLATKLHV